MPVRGPFTSYLSPLTFYCPTPWHFLYFFPEPQGQGSFRPTVGSPLAEGPSRPIEVSTRGAGGGAPIGAVLVLAEPAKSSSVPFRGVGIGGGGGGCRGASALTWIFR